MKLNKKGFLLAETIVTVCIIATLATSMYLYISKTASRFEDRNNYEGVVDVYKVNTLKKYLESINYLDDAHATGEISTTDLGVLKSDLNIEEAYLIFNTGEKKNELINNASSQALTDYLKWLSIEGDSDDLRLIVWFKSNDSDGTFANLRITK